jgi:hypothetical protein
LLRKSNERDVLGVHEAHLQLHEPNGFQVGASDHGVVENLHVQSEQRVKM